MRLRALTLSEVVVAISIMSVAVLALLSLQVASLRWKRQSLASQQASLLATSLLNESVSRLRLNFAETVSRAPEASGVEGFEQSVAVEEEQPGALKRLEVVVTWKTERGPQRVRLVTWVYNG